MTLKEFQETTVATIRNMPIGLWRRFMGKCKTNGLTAAQGAIEAFNDWLEKE